MARKRFLSAVISNFWPVFAAWLLGCPSVESALDGRGFVIVAIIPSWRSAQNLVNGNCLIPSPMQQSTPLHYTRPLAEVLQRLPNGPTPAFLKLSRRSRWHCRGTARRRRRVRKSCREPDFPGTPCVHIDASPMAIHLYGAILALAGKMVFAH